MVKCARCGEIIKKGEEYREGELFRHPTPESEMVGYYQLCLRCFESIDAQVIGF